MSNNEFGNLKGVHHPSLHAFFVPTPTGLVLSNHDNTSPEVVDTNAKQPIPSIISSSTSVPKLKSPILSSSNSISSTLLFNTPASTTIRPPPPPLIVNDPSFNDKTPINKSHADGTCWIAPLLGVLGTVGVVAIAIIYLIGRNKKKNAIYVHDDSLNLSRGYDDQHPTVPKTPEAAKILPNSYQSWASLSTINTSAANNNDGEKNNIIHHAQEHSLPPPAYTSIRQKRMTADTLVDDNHVAMMLQNQYSPQLAFSPSLVAGEFQQQQQQLVEERPPLPTLSPSNTLIDNAGALSSTNDVKSENYHYSFDQRPKRIEIYEPQVNLQDDNSFNPYSYSHDDEDDSKTKEHYIVNINSKQ